MRYVRVLLAILLGCLTFMVGSFAEGGATHNRPPLVIGIVVVLYLAVAQFLVAKKGVNLWGNLGTIIGMGAPVLALLIVMVITDPPYIVLEQGPILGFGCLGIIAGALAAGAWRTK